MTLPFIHGANGGKKVIACACKWCFAGFVLWILFRHFGVSWRSVSGLLQSRAWLLAACTIRFTLIPLVSVNRWKLFLLQMGIRERFWTLYKINLIANFQGLVLPSSQGFDVLRMYHLSKRHPGCPAKATGSVLVERLFGMWIFGVMALAGLGFAAPKLDDPLPVILAVSVFAMAVAGGSILLLNRRLYNLYAEKIPDTPRWGRLAKFFRDIHESLVDFPYRKVFWSSVAYIALFQLATILVGWFLFRACGHPVPFGVHLAFYPVISTIALLPVTIGGFGLREGGFAYFYPLVGVPPEVAIAVSILNYAVLILLPAPLGALLWLLDAKKYKLLEKHRPPRIPQRDISMDTPSSSFQTIPRTHE